MIIRIFLNVLKFLKIKYTLDIFYLVFYGFFSLNKNIQIGLKKFLYFKRVFLKT